ncbi:MAG: dTDP-4-dehydrorhamnose reductase [Patescibacteria group bacterium]
MLRKSKILILGAQGMLGSDLVKVFSEKQEVTAWDREDIDVTQETEVMAKILPLEPQVIINATGYTDVDSAEDNQDTAFKVNTEAVKFITLACEKVNARLVHFSTEYVFDGTNKAGYKEDSVTNPLNIYGQSKSQGEKFVLKYSKGYLIRTSWLFGKAPQKGKPRGLNFIDTMIKMASEREEIKVVNDQFGKPTYTRDLTKAVHQLITEDYQPGIYHLVNDNVCSWYDLAKEVLRIKNINTPILPITSSEYPTKARRPQYAVLLNTKFPHFRPWQEALRQYLELFD